MPLFRTLAVSTALSLIVSAAIAAPPGNWSQGFETDTSGWVSGLQSGADFGTITRATGPLAPFEGGAYAVLTQGTSGALRYAPFTLWGGYSTTFPVATGYSTRLAIYLSPSTWTPGQGFDYASAIGTPSGGHLHDYFFHVAVQGNGALLIGAGLATNYGPRMNLVLGPFHQVDADGWYIFEHAFSATHEGTLSAELRLLNPSGTGIFSQTFVQPGDMVPTVVGGNRYGWFSFVGQPTAIDGALIPAPGMGVLVGLLGFGVIRRKRL